MGTRTRRVAGVITAAIAIAAGCGACAPQPASSAGTTLLGTTLPHGLGAWPHVTVEDDTAGGFPIRAAITGWGVPVEYGRCVSWASCIRIHEKPALPAGHDAGLTTQHTTPGRPETVDIYLADTLPAGPERLEDACHEFGHALGLGHDVTGGCMRSFIAPGDRPRPSAADLTRLRELYLRAGR